MKHASKTGRLIITMKTLLVGGGAGFIGSNFVHWMLAKYPDLKIVNVDKLTYAGNLDNLSDVNADRHTFIQADIADSQKMDEVIESHKPDAIVNFAAETHVDRSIHEGLRDFVFANVMGPQVLAEATKKFNIPLYIQISTDEVFGSLELDEDRLFREDTAFAPNMPYAACKAGGDLICRSYFQTFKTPIIVTHCSNNYGPFQYPEKFIPQAISKALADQPIPIYGMVYMYVIGFMLLITAVRLICCFKKVFLEKCITLVLTMNVPTLK